MKEILEQIEKLSDEEKELLLKHWWKSETEKLEHWWASKDSDKDA